MVVAYKRSAIRHQHCVQQGMETSPTIQDNGERSTNHISLLEITQKELEAKSLTNIFKTEHLQK